MTTAIPTILRLCHTSDDDEIDLRQWPVPYAAAL